MFPSLMTSSMVEGQKTPEPEKEPNFELMRALIYEQHKQCTGFALPTEYGPTDLPVISPYLLNLTTWASDFLEIFAT